MIPGFSPEAELFRQQLRDFLDDHLDSALAERVRLHCQLSRAEVDAWLALLRRHGWLAGCWPTEFGGGGWSPEQGAIFNEECALAYAPPLPGAGIGHIGPLLHRHGSPAQQARWLPRILDSRDWWCLGFSEDEAGSDLAALHCQAQRDGDDFVVTGHKAWVSQASDADIMLTLLRTDPDAPAPQGISLLAIELDRPGISLRPRTMLDGLTQMHEVALDGVRVPAGNLIGSEHGGWAVAGELLTRARALMADIGGGFAALQRLKRAAQTMRQYSRPIAADPVLAARIAEAQVDLLTLRMTDLRLRRALGEGRLTPSMAAILKIGSTGIRQRLDGSGRAVFGPWAIAAPKEMEGNPQGTGLAIPPEAVAANFAYMNNRKLSLAGGSTEVLRELVVRALLDGDDVPAPLPDAPSPLCHRLRRILADPPEDAWLWDTLGEAGVLAAMLPSGSGGTDGAGPTIAAIFEEIGRAGVSTPIAENMLLGAAMLALHGDFEDLVETVMCGGQRVAFAYLEAPSLRYGLRADLEVRDDRLSGQKYMVVGGDMADWIIVTTARGLYLVARDVEGMTRRSYDLLDGNRAADLTFRHSPATPIGALDDYLVLMSRGLLARCAIGIGAMEAVKTRCVVHLRQRHQFGQPLAQFQAISHRLADMAVGIEHARSAVLNLAHGVDAPRETVGEYAFACKNVVSRVAREVAEAAMQIHGTSGLMDAPPLAGALRQLLYIETAFGDADYHLHQIMMQPDFWPRTGAARL